MATVLHIGFHKTGTTTLQQRFFPQLEGCALLGPATKDLGKELLRVTIDLATANDDVYSEAPFRDLMDRARGDAPTLIVSNEDISAHSASGRTAARLHHLVPEAKVLICVREQRSALGARYGQYVKKGGSQTFANYVAGRPSDWLRYDTLVDEYRGAFGPDRVKVLAFEQLIADQPAFVRELHEFVTGRSVSGAEFGDLPRVNQTLAPPTRHVVRVANRWFVTSQENPHPPLGRVTLGSRAVRKLMKLDPVVFPKMARRLGPRDRAFADKLARERYRQGNAQLAKLTGLPLQDYGYVLGDS